jgi:hypothetical protein
LKCSKNCSKLGQETTKPSNQIYLKKNHRRLHMQIFRDPSFFGIPIFMGLTPLHSLNNQDSHKNNFRSSMQNLSFQNHKDKLPNPLQPFIISDVFRPRHSNFKPNNCPNFLYATKIKERNIKCELLTTFFSSIITTTKLKENS